MRSIVDDSRVLPSIDVAAFPATPSRTFWSSSSYAGGVFGAWNVRFSSGHVDYTGKTYASYVRCVRRGPADVPVPRFTRTEPVASYPVVADAATGLVWQGCAAGQTGLSCSGTEADFNWQAALDYCQDSTWAALADWYIPNAKELRSVVDDRLSYPAIDTTAFPNTPDTAGAWFWSSSSLPFRGASDGAWHVDSAFGSVWLGGKSVADSYVRCVRVGP